MKYRQRSSVAILAAWVAVASAVTTARAGFLDITLLRSTNGGAFIGTLDGVGVTGLSTASAGTYSFSPTGNIPNNDTSVSTIDNSSPQYSYANVYAPAIPLTDKVGYYGGDISSATVTILFATPVTDLRFHVGDLDRGTYNFQLTGGLTGISLVRGNGGSDGDGLLVAGTTVRDAYGPTVTLGYGTNLQPPTTGGRSAFGTIALNGTVSALTFGFSSASPVGSGGSFTLSSVPEPTAAALAGVAAIAGLLRRRRSSPSCVVS